VAGPEQLLLIYVDFAASQTWTWTSVGNGKHKLKEFFDNPWKIMILIILSKSFHYNFVSRAGAMAAGESQLQS